MPQKRAVSATQSPVSARVVGDAVCTRVTGIAEVGGGEVTTDVAVVMFIGGAGTGVESSSSGLRVYTCSAPIDTFGMPESFKKTESVL